MNHGQVHLNVLSPSEPFIELVHISTRRAHKLPYRGPRPERSFVHLSRQINRVEVVCFLVCDRTPQPRGDIIGSTKVRNRLRYWSRISKPRRSDNFTRRIDFIIREDSSTGLFAPDDSDNRSTRSNKLVGNRFRLLPRLNILLPHRGSPRPRRHPRPRNSARSQSRRRGSRPFSLLNRLGYRSVLPLGNNGLDIVLVLSLREREKFPIRSSFSSKVSLHGKLSTSEFHELGRGFGCSSRMYITCIDDTQFGA
jgi:hypothetical protein